MPLSNIEEAAEDIRAGKMIIIVDDETAKTKATSSARRRKVTPAIINFMVTHAAG
jgi:3,4-dihydroxy 2-butanone 4-phosphate synthase/GTP cyclohydrolase II